MAPVAPKKQQQRKHLTLQEKLEIIELREKGSTFAKISKDKKMNESSIRTIYQNRDKIRDQGIQTADYTAMIPMIRPRSRAKLEMEETLFIWVENCAKR